MPRTFTAVLNKFIPFLTETAEVGRLLLAAMLLKENLPPAVIRQEKRWFYILDLNESQTEDFIRDAILAGINRLIATLHDFLPQTDRSEPSVK